MHILSELLLQNKSASQLVQDIKSLIASNNPSKKDPPTIRLLFGDVPIEESSNPVRQEIFDGVELTVQITTISVLITVSKTYVVNISQVSLSMVLIVTISAKALLVCATLDL